MKWLIINVFVSVSFFSCAQKAENPVVGTSEVAASDYYNKDLVKKPETEWKKELTEKEFYILRQKGTERAYSGDLWDFKGDGVYVCAGCHRPLFDSKTKFDSGTGWPSFYKPINTIAVDEEADLSYGWNRTEVHCHYCGGHLGHVFPDGPRPTGLRYCINSYSLDFLPREDVPAKPKN